MTYRLLRAVSRLRALFLLMAAMLALPALAAAQTPPQLPPGVSLPVAKPAAPAPRGTNASSPDAGYNIGPDDVIEVDVLGQQDFKTRARVRADGTIQLPFLGAITVSGKTPVSLAQDVTSKLQAGGYYAKPIVNVEIVSFASRYVIVLGEVGQPGLTPVDRNYRLSEVIARVGGIKDSGADYVVLRRGDQPEMRLSFEKLATGSDAEDPYVQPGDKIYVPAADIFYIYGQVSAPGAYPIKSGMSFRKALARAGGLTAAGSEKRMKIFHNGVAQPVDLEKLVQAGDVVVVGERLF